MALPEIVTVGRTMQKRADDILAYFDPARHFRRTTEAIDDWLEQLRGS
ncbi:MAG: hypothetical protein ACOYX5_11875 [Actinomycetota bacterium]